MVDTKRKYALATQASNLSLEDHKEGHADVLIASGMASRIGGSRLGQLMMRLSSDFDLERRSKGDSINALKVAATYAAAKTALQEWAVSKRIKSSEDAVIMGLAYYLDSHCKKCKGAGEILKGRMAMTCTTCEGRGCRQEPKIAHEVLDHINACVNAHLGRIRKLSRHE